MSGSDAAALKAVGERMMPFSSKIQALGDDDGVGDLAGCSNELSGTGVSLVSDVGVCSLTEEKTG